MSPDPATDGEQKSPASLPKRRPRYSGKNPRRFEEKYKEHNHEQHPETVAKIIAGGKTVAGTHRPICVAEIMEVLHAKSGDIAVDATLGYGGHAAELLKSILPGGVLLGLDADPIELPRTEERLRKNLSAQNALIVRRCNFAGLPSCLSEAGIEGADVIVADLGLSSMQIDNPKRGFTFKFEGPLDLRMNPQKGQPASMYLKKVTREKLATALFANSDEPFAETLSEAIVAAGRLGAIETTTDLAKIVRTTLKSQQRADSQVQAAIRRVFQALRIEVNDEFGALDTFLVNLPYCLKPGGRVAILTFHSGEDRRVKKSFQHFRREGVYETISDEVIRASVEEVRSNPRASSAKLRWAIKAV